MGAAISFTGRLTADPELKYTPSGAAVVNFSVAVNERKFDRSTNQWVDGEAMYLNVEAWKQLAEGAGEALTRGSLVTITGELKPDNWEKDGQKRTGFKVSANEIGASVKGFKPSERPVGEPAW